MESPPYEYGYQKGFWTSKIIGDFIRRETGICYSKSRICELMHEWDFEIKRPRMVSTKKNKEVQRKFTKEFPTIVKEAQNKAVAMGLKLKLLWTDEVGIRRDGTIHYGWYKKGILAEVPESGGRFESIKLFGAVDAKEGKFNIKRAPGKITTSEYALFLKHLSEHYKDYYLLIIHDNAPWHGNVSLTNHMENLNIANIGIVRLPTYSPEMNSCEKLWYWMRATVTHCRYYEDLPELMESIWKFYRRASNQVGQAKQHFKTEINLLDYCENLLDSD